MKNPHPRTNLACLLAAACLALAPAALAVDPPPGGGYPGMNTALGEDAFFNGSSDAGGNTALGFHALFANLGGFANTATGSRALASNIGGLDNTATGNDALFNNTDGFGNTATGTNALYSNVAGGNNTATGLGALNFHVTGSYNTATGYFAMSNSAKGDLNTATGFAALISNEAQYNTADGAQALTNNFSGKHNTGIGFDALTFSITGSNNTALGAKSLAQNGDGNANIALGYKAGFNITTGSNNIYIGNLGVNGDAGVTRIGNPSTATNTYVAGVNGVTVAGGTGVVIDAAGHLGTITSSARYKDAIKPMAKTSEVLLALQPVTFRYKKALDPDLVARDEEGKPYTVRYEAVNAMLLNEFLKEHQRVEEQAHINQRQEATMAKQQKEIETLTATLKEQAAQIEKVTRLRRVGANKPAAQMVADNQ